jgi:hypothetical protein
MDNKHIVQFEKSFFFFISLKDCFKVGILILF